MTRRLPLIAVALIAAGVLAATLTDDGTAA